MRRRRSAPTVDCPWGVPTELGSRIPLASLIQTLAVAEYLNFRHAANALGVAQSSVSARVKSLEEDLGILLFERHARGVRLTEAGRHFVDRIASGVEQLDHAVKTAGMAAVGEWGRLRIGIHALIPRSFLAELIGQYREAHPGIEVEITEGTARDAVMKLRADRLDVAFVAGSPELPDCHTRPIWTEPLVAVLPERHPLAAQPAVTWADLTDETFLVRHGGTGPQVHDLIVVRAAGKWPVPSIRRSDVGRDSLLSMIAAGDGVSLFVAENLTFMPPGVVYREIDDEPDGVAFSAIWSPQGRNPVLGKLLSLATEMSRSV